MKIVLTKPAKGVTTITLNDRRGRTGIKRVAKDVAVEDVGTVAGGLLAEWEGKYLAIKEARKLARRGP